MAARDERIAAVGTWGAVEWAFDARRRMPALEFFAALVASDRDKVQALFDRLAETGSILNREKFKALGGRLFEFKSHQLRFLGAFLPGKRFVVAHGLRKKQDALSASDIQVALRILAENDAVEKGGR